MANLFDKIRMYFKQRSEGISVNSPYNNLFISSAIRTRDDVIKLKLLGIAHVIDLSGEIDKYADNFISYLYFPFKDEEDLPNMDLLRCVALYGYDLLIKKEIVLCHWTMGLNRGSLLAGYIMGFCGVNPKETIQRIRNVRGSLALSNKTFEKFLMEL